MTTIISRNTIQLASNASAVNNVYSGYDIILTRFDSTTGKALTQRQRIIAYNGASKIATIGSIWDADFIPTTTDTYQIVPKNTTDRRVSINPAIQTLDYMTSNRYGRNLDVNRDLALQSWLESARVCDTRSDVTVFFTTATTNVAVGDVYRYFANSLHFEGTVKSKNGQYVRFTNVIGKLTHKWNSWKTFYAGAVVYNGTNLYYNNTTGVKPDEPTGSTQGYILNGLEYKYSGISLTKVSGAGPTTLVTPWDSNPVRDISPNGTIISGYSLYDADGVDYWRLLGWDEHSQRYATRHQTNLMIDTSQAVLDNLNSFLEHYNGMLRYSQGKYYLEIEEAAGAIPDTDNDPRNLDDDNIIGKVRLTDDGLKSAFNSLSVAYPDPANKFDAKTISFFNSDYLKTDRNVPKKGNLAIPGITNYYNARIMSDKFLVKSRYGLNVNLNMAPVGALLTAGTVIQLTQPRYGWVDKEFRIENMTHNPDTTVDIVASEYDDKFYAISNISRPPAAAMAAEPHLETTTNPSGLKATNIADSTEQTAGIQLNWVNDPKANTGNVTIELYSSRLSKLFVTVTSITGGLLFNTPTPHGLVIGDVITAQTGTNGLQFGKRYVVKTTPNTSAFTLSESTTGAILNFTNGSALSLNFLTASLLTTLRPPTNSYIDVVPGVTGSPRVEKYYWLRYKIEQR
jgi:hypothetical protein